MGKGITEGINGGVGTTEENIKLTLLKQLQDYAWVYLTMVMKIACK